MADMGQSVDCNSVSALLMRTSIIKLRNAVFSNESLRLSTTSLIDRLSATLAAVQMLCGSVARQRRTRCVKSRASL
ncbi:hypothetical protein D3C80_1896400 [compost metagenome]